MMNTDKAYIMGLVAWGILLAINVIIDNIAF